MDLETLNPEARERLASLVKKEIAELSVQDIAFLQSRREYLTDKQADKFSEILTDSQIEKVQAKVLKDEQSKDKKLGVGAFTGQAAPQEEAPVVEEVVEAPKKAKK